MIFVSILHQFGTFVRNAEQTKADVRNLRSACRRHRIEFARTQEGRYELETQQPQPQQQEEARTKEDGSAGQITEQPAGRGKFLVSNQGETVWVKL